MPREKTPNDESDFFDKLFGDPAELADEDLNLLFDALAPGSDVKVTIHNIAESAAVKYRSQNRLPPDHVQTALDATKEAKSLENVTPSKLHQIVEAIKEPFTRPVSDPVFAYRNRTGKLDSDDQAIIDNLTEELQSDWDEGEEKEGK